MHYRTVKRYRIYDGTEYETPEEAQKQAERLAGRMLREFLEKDEYLRCKPLLLDQASALLYLLIERQADFQKILDCINFGDQDYGNTKQN